MIVVNIYFSLSIVLKILIQFLFFLINDFLGVCVFRIENIWKHFMVDH